MIAVFLLAVFGFVFIAGTTPVDQALWLTLVYNVGGVVIFLGLALAWYQRYIKRLSASDPRAARIELAPSAAGAGDESGTRSVGDAESEGTSARGDASGTTSARGDDGPTAEEATAAATGK